MKISTSQIPHIYPEHLTRAGERLAEMLEEFGRPVMQPYFFFRLIERMYANSKGKRLYLRSDVPGKEDYARLRQNLKNARYISFDRDYGSRAIRALTVSDVQAEEVACLVDPTCYVSHLSAMQRWGLTNRTPGSLFLTRPSREQAYAELSKLAEEDGGYGEKPVIPLKYVRHPARVRRRKVSVRETIHVGQSVSVRGTWARISTIGQTFLDMLKDANLCGGVTHTLDVWQEHAPRYLGEIVGRVDQDDSPLVKSRAGYILDELMGVHHQTIEGWSRFVQRGSSRKLDPTRPFSEKYSKKWAISLNV